METANETEGANLLIDRINRDRAGFIKEAFDGIAKKFPTLFLRLLEIWPTLSINQRTSILAGITMLGDAVRDIPLAPWPTMMEQADRSRWFEAFPGENFMRFIPIDRLIYGRDANSLEKEEAAVYLAALCTQFVS